MYVDWIVLTCVCVCVCVTGRMFICTQEMHITKFDCSQIFGQILNISVLIWGILLEPASPEL